MVHRRTSHQRLCVALLVGSLLSSTAGIAVAAETEHREGGGAAQEAADPHAKHRAMLTKASPRTSANIRLIERTLVTQDGEQVDFVRDVIGERIVVMNFVYTTCTTVCPVLSAIFKQLQDRLGERLGQAVHLVSLSVDPVRDTPQRLKVHAEQQRARRGWEWLTGEKTAVDQILEGLGAYTPNFEDHPSMVLVGDGRSGEWTRFFGFPSPNQIMARVDTLVAKRQMKQE